MIQTFINGAIAHRTSALDLSERENFFEHDTKAIDRFDEPPKVDAGRTDCDAARTQHEPDPTHTALCASNGMEGPAVKAATREWRAFKIALLILCINFAAAGLLAIVAFDPALALLGFFVEFCVMTLTSLPMLLALVSEAAEKHQT